MPKTDYYDDPTAPSPNSLVVAVAAFVRDDAAQVLLIRRVDNDTWTLPGGRQDIGETTSQATIRRVREETGVDVEITGVVGIYSDPGHIIAYDDGEVRQEFSICLRARAKGEALTTSDESKEVHWVDPERLVELNVDRFTRRPIDDGLAVNEQPHID